MLNAATCLELSLDEHSEVRFMIERERPETFDTLRRNDMKILETDPEVYFNVFRREDHRFGFVDDVRDESN